MTLSTGTLFTGTFDFSGVLAGGGGPTMWQVDFTGTISAQIKNLNDGFELI